jgi:Cu2+-exporting ATPase
MEQHEHHSPEHDHHEHHMAEQGATGQDVAAVEVHEDHETHGVQDDHADHGAHAAHDSHAGHHAHIFKKQFFISLGLTIPTLVFSPMIGQWLGYGNLFPGSNYIAAAFGTAMLFTVGRIFLTSGWGEIKRRKPGMMALIALALVVAFGYSLFLLVANAFGLNIMAGMDFWWELAALITIMLGGHWVEMNSVQRAQNSVGELVKLIPDVVEIIEDGFPVKTSTRLLEVGNLVLVRTGYSIPADGVIERGQSRVNEAMLTGESAPVLKGPGDQVFGGTLNAVSGKAPEFTMQGTDDEEFELPLGALTVRITAVGDQSVIGHIVQLVKQAQASKSETQRLADRAAGWLFYAALGAAALTALVWSLTGQQSLSFILERVVTVLVIACPHALGLAIPLVTAITTDNAARNGVLIRNRAAFEQLRKVDTVLFDKTGTLTEGNRSFVSAHVTRRGGLESVDELLAVAAGLEQESEHSIAGAILAEAQARGIDPVPVKDIMSIPGIGVSGRIDEFKLQAGGPAILTKNRIDVDVQDLYAADAANSAGYTSVYVLRNDLLLGFIAIGDVTRPTSADAVWELHQLDKKVAILTGDAHEVAKAVGKELDIEEIYAEVLPARKAEAVSDLQAKGRVVAMVGDGINDAPALTQADVGIAIGSGTDVAVESADIVLVSDDPESVAKAIKLAKRSYAKMLQNLWWGAGYNIIAIPLAAGVFQPIGLVLSPAVGAILMTASTIVVAANAQLLRRQKD